MNDRICAVHTGVTEWDIAKAKKYGKTDPICAKCYRKVTPRGNIDHFWPYHSDQNRCRLCAS
jgi:hypothetical protein